MGIPIRGGRLFLLGFAGGQVLVAQDEEDLSYMLRKLRDGYARAGVEINFEKTGLIKMRFLLAFIPFIFTTHGFSDLQQWEYFKIKYNKSYKNALEESTRYTIFRNNIRLITEHNSKYVLGKKSYTTGINKFSDRTLEEFKNQLGVIQRPTRNLDSQSFPDDFTVPDSIDWREKGAVMEVKDQKDCKSCWAFGATGALEGQNAIINNVSKSLSEQELLDCSDDYGNGDCDHLGITTNAFEYVRDHGIGSEADYPYEAQRKTCRAKSDKTVLNIKGFKDVRQTEEDLKKAVGSIGPISVVIYAQLLKDYKGGIFNEPDCFSSTLYLDHEALVVGYGTLDSQPYWILKNSWGTDWGEDGYLRLARNANQCGIALIPTYPLL